MRHLNHIADTWSSEEMDRINQALWNKTDSNLKVANNYSLLDDDTIVLCGEYSDWAANKNEIKNVMRMCGYDFWQVNTSDDYVVLDFKIRDSFNKKYKIMNRIYRKVQDGAGRADFPSILEAFESVYNEGMLKEATGTDIYLVDNSYQYDSRYGNNGIARFDFNHPNAQYVVTSGYSCGSVKIDQIVEDKFDETYDELIAENGQDNDDVWYAAYEYEQEHTDVTYVAYLEEVQGGVQIMFAIGAGYVSATEYGVDTIFDECVSSPEEAEKVARMIVGFIGGIQFD